MHKTATIILNRNLPKETDSLVQHIQKNNKDLTDVFVVEAGSDEDNLSAYCSWHVKDPEVLKNGLRYSRGMNFALFQLFKEEKWDKYDSFFLITNDTKFPEKQNTIEVLQSILEYYPRIGICSPCSKKWAEEKIIGPNSLKYFWYIHNNAYLMRREYLDCIINFEDDDYINFLFDGSNFRGYLSESEIIAKAYVNDWAAAITTKVYSEEDESMLLTKSNVIKTETYQLNLDLYVEEGLKWIKRKYGFNSRWQMMQYSKLMYDKFFTYFPGELKNKI